MLLGQSKYGTPLSLYHELRGDPVPHEDSELLAEGRAFEPVILAMGAKKFGMRLFKGPEELAHGDLVGHPDAYVIDEHGKLAIAESKNLLFADSGEEAGWGEAETDRVPMAYWFQCQVYGHLLLKCGVNVGASGGFESLEVSDTVYLFARLWHGTRRYRIKVDPAVIAHIEREASAFLDRVARGEPPDPSTGEEFRRRWVPVPDKTVEFTATELGLLKARQDLKKQIKLAEEQVGLIDMQLLGFLQDAAAATWNGKRVLTASADREFDEAAFAVECPEEFVRYSTKLDKTALRKNSPGIYEMYLRLPADPATQTRKLRPNDKALGEIQ
jgi:hypothetical protein